MFHLNQTPGRTAIVDGKECLFFSGYSYLGMNHVAGFVDLIKEGIDKYGWLFPSSRISNTQLDLFGEFEEKLSAITGMEDTVCFSSGFLAGRAVIELFKGVDYSCAPQTHPAICTEKADTTGFDEWARSAGDAPVLLFDSVNPLTSEVNDTSFLQQPQKKTTCIIDDSHGAGLLNNGKGVGGSLPANKNVDYILTYSLSKAYNLPGGAVSCSNMIADELRNCPHYTASTSISPAFAYAFLKGQHLYDQQREKLEKNIGTFRALTGERFKSHPELPIFILPAHFNTDKIKEAVIISSFAYPDPQGERINRIVLNALHTDDDLKRLAEVLR
jgi:8-amino-7-oxononanoate synthase